MAKQPKEVAAASLMHDLARYIEAHSADVLTLEVLAGQVHLSPHYVQRRFKAVIGVSPREYQEACRVRQLKGLLREDASVTEALYEAGFGSSSRVYERGDRRFGMTPGAYRARGKGVAISYAMGHTQLGEMLIGATDRGICFLQFGLGDQELLKLLQQEYPAAVIGRAEGMDREQFGLWMEALSGYLAGGRAGLDLPLDIRGTAFQVKVWNYLQQIPRGEVRSYTELAEAIGQPKAVRAVASACARNRVAVLVPCHRVIRGDGGLAGYRWGLERKQALLELEGGDGGLSRAVILNNGCVRV